MVVLRAQGVEAEFEVEDFDVGETWLSYAHKQLEMGTLSFDTLEEGDVLAMWDRNAWDEDWPGREVFVWLAHAGHILLFDAFGELIDEPEAAVPGGVQQLRGDLGFQQEWTSGSDGYYIIPTTALGLPPALGLPAPPPPPQPVSRPPSRSATSPEVPPVQQGTGETRPPPPSPVPTGAGLLETAEQHKRRTEELSELTQEGVRVKVSFDDSGGVSKRW